MRKEKQIRNNNKRLAPGYPRHPLHDAPTLPQAKWGKTLLLKSSHTPPIMAENLHLFEYIIRQSKTIPVMRQRTRRIAALD
jgi:hypothetical protein